MGDSKESEKNREAISGESVPNASEPLRSIHTTSVPEILRQLASEKAEIAALPVHREKAALWTNLNDLESHRPMVWIDQQVPTSCPK